MRVSCNQSFATLASYLAIIEVRAGYGCKIQRPSKTPAAKSRMARVLVILEHTW